jgi:3-methyladenine DNA glycosylase AlkD
LVNRTVSKNTMTSNSVHAYVNAVEAALTPLSDSERAMAMAAYMKHHFQFLGIPTPERRKAIKSIAKPELADAPAIARALWKRKEREYHYVAVDLLASMAKKLDPWATLALIEELALTHSWWDSVDGLVSVGSTILRHHRDARDVVWQWSAHPSFWVNRLAILHQNGWGDMTDKKMLFKLCLAHAHNEEFFIRKAIGWALRDYAWTHPQAVQAFVDANRSKLSALSAREALKNIGVCRQA